MAMSQTSKPDLMFFVTVFAAAACITFAVAPELDLPWPLPFAAFLLWVLASTAFVFLPRRRCGPVMLLPTVAPQAQCPVSTSQSLTDVMRFMMIVAVVACTAAVTAPEPRLPWLLPFAAFVLWVLASTAAVFLPRRRCGPGVHTPPAAPRPQYPVSTSQGLADLMRFMTMVAAAVCTAAVAAPVTRLPWLLPFAAFLLWVITSTAVFFLPRRRHGPGS